MLIIGPAEFVHFQSTTLRISFVAGASAAVVCRLCESGFHHLFNSILFYSILLFLGVVANVFVLLWVYLSFSVCKFHCQTEAEARAHSQAMEWKCVNVDCLLPLRLYHLKFITSENATAMQCDYSTLLFILIIGVPAVRTIRQYEFETRWTNQIHADFQMWIRLRTIYVCVVFTRKYGTCLLHVNRFVNLYHCLCLFSSLFRFVSHFHFASENTSSKWDQTGLVHVHIQSLYLRQDIAKPPVFS